MSKKLFRSKTDPYPLAAKLFKQLRDLDENEGWYAFTLINIIEFCKMAINLDRLDGDAHVLLANALLLVAYRGIKNNDRESYAKNMLNCAAVIYEWKTNPKMFSIEKEMGEKIYSEVIKLLKDPKSTFRNKGIYNEVVDIKYIEEKMSDVERLYVVSKLREQLKIPAATHYLKSGIMENPNNATFHSVLGGVYIYLRLYDEAEAELRTILKLDPNHDVHGALATVYEAQNKLDKAIREFEISLTTESSNWDAHWLLARSYRKKGRLKDALREYKIFAQNSSGGLKAITYFLIGEIYSELGQSDEAIKAFQQSLNAQHNKTKESQQRTSIDEFQASLANQIELNEGEVHFRLGKCYQRNGQKNLSIREFKIASKLGYKDA